MASNRSESTPLSFLKLGVLYLAYAATFVWVGFISVKFQSSPTVSSWYLPAGLVFATLIWRGIRFVPMALLATFSVERLVYNYPWSLSLILTLIVIVVYTSAALLLIQVFVINRSPSSQRDFVYLSLTALIAPFFVALPCVSILIRQGIIPKHQLWTATLDWWEGDVMGIVSLTPFLLANLFPATGFALAKFRNRLATARGEPAQPLVSPFGNFKLRRCWGLPIMLIAITLIVILGWPDTRNAHVTYLYLIPLIWIIIRHGIGGASISVLLLNIGAVIFAKLSGATPLQFANLQIIALPLSLAALFLGSAVREQRKSELAIQLLNKDLEKRISRRTFQLEASRQKLENEIVERRQAQEDLHRQQIEVRRLNTELEQRVAKRTAQLAALNQRLKRDVEERKRSEARFRAMNEASPLGIFVTDPKGDYLHVNPSYLKICNASLEATLARGWIQRIHPEDRDEVSRTWDESINRTPFHYDQIQRFRHPSGRIVWTRVHAAEMIEDGQRLGFVGTVEDITDKRSLEEQLQHSQKMEAVGRLAGGVAHDFNNLLMVIQGYASLMLRHLQPENPDYARVHDIQQAADHATTITRQLLTFSRKQIVRPKVLDLNTLLADSERMIKQLAGEKILIEIIPYPNLYLIEIDPVHLRQALLNLITNSQDAMPAGGTITLSTSNLNLPEGTSSEAHPNLPSGSYVILRARDTGCGIPSSILPHIFEPFFTTKKRHNGTGLGLSTTYGIVQQAKGHIFVESQPSEGTCFTLIFPSTSKTISPLSDEEASSEALDTRGSECILLAEDDALVRSFCRQTLESRGYSVLDASNGRQALDLFHKASCPIHLILTDLIMPEMGGPELIQTISKDRKGLKYIMMSGYTDARVDGKFIHHHRIVFLRKPISPDALLVAVRQTLDLPTETGSP